MVANPTTAPITAKPTPITAIKVKAPVATSLPDTPSAMVLYEEMASSASEDHLLILLPKYSCKNRARRQNIFKILKFILQSW